MQVHTRQGHLGAVGTVALGVDDYFVLGVLAAHCVGEAAGLRRARLGRAWRTGTPPFSRRAVRPQGCQSTAAGRQWGATRVCSLSERGGIARCQQRQRKQRQHCRWARPPPEWLAPGLQKGVCLCAGWAAC